MLRIDLERMSKKSKIDNQAYQKNKINQREFFGDGDDHESDHYISKVIIDYQSGNIFTNIKNEKHFCLFYIILSLGILGFREEK
jgi:hypothetical protein